MLSKPLAEILRPKTLEQYIGQEHLMGEGAILRAAIQNKAVHSMILWGPPGVGKTTLALLIAELVGANFYMLSAISSGVKDIRTVFDEARKKEGQTILFIDEIHRFSKSQQDSLLGAVEQGLVTLIGATTENPSFEVISPLLSRCQVYVLKNLEREHLEKILSVAKNYLEEALQCSIKIAENAALLRISGGDARKLINAIELVVTTLAVNKPTEIVITNEIVQKIIQKNLAIYDKKGEQHYDIIAAFIKSVRGSDPNAAVYWLARMLSGGEDPLFIARRLIILASEDIGNANPNALLLANACYQAVHQIGMPEARIILSQTTVYLACSPKSNASYLAIDEALAWVQKTGDLPVPLHIRNAPTQLMKDLGYHKDYKYAHDYEHNFVEQEFLPTSISGKKFYEPQDNARENELRKYLKKCWKDKYKYVLLILAFLSIFMHGIGQDLHYSQYSAAPLNLNPALCGVIDGTFRAGLNQRTQWLAVSKPFLTFSASVDLPVYKNHRRRNMLGAGILLNADRAGDSQFTQFQPVLALSYMQSLDRRHRHKLAIGAYAGLIRRSINYGALTFGEQYLNGKFSADNPITEEISSEKKLNFDFGVGVHWLFTPTEHQSYFAGVSLSHLNQAEQSFYGDKSVLLPLKTALYVGGKVPIWQTLFLNPQIFVAFQSKFTEINFGAMFEYQHQRNSYTNDLAFGAGAFYRWADALIVAGSVRWQNLRVAVSYDINVSTLRRASRGRGALELSLQYILRRAAVKSVGQEPCPFEIM